MKPKHFILTLLALLPCISSSAYEFETYDNGYLWTCEVISESEKTVSIIDMDGYVTDGSTVTTPKTITDSSTGTTYSVISLGVNDESYSVIYSVFDGYDDEEAFGNAHNYTIVVSEGVTSIYPHTFWGLSNNGKIYLPYSLTHISSSAFWCDDITIYVPLTFNLTVSDCTVNTFIPFKDETVRTLCVANWDTNGDGVVNETEAAAVTSLGEVFKNNMTITSFNELQYFTGLTEINDYAFRNTIALTSVIIPENVTRIGKGSFGQVVDIGASNLVSVQLPDGLTEIDEDAFWECNKLKNINIPTNLRSIGDGAFHYTAIESLILPEGFLSIGNGACNYCNSLESIYIPSTVTHIVDGSVDCTFGGCEVLHSIVVAENNPVYDSRNNCNALIESSTNRLIRGSNQTIIPSGIVSIERQAFDFSNISQINIPSTVTTMCDYAFGGCQYLKMVKVNSETPITITSDVFSSDFRGGSNIHSITLYVPNGCKAAYEAADCWKEFKEIIETNTVNVGSTGFATYCSPNALDFSGVTDIKAYVASDFDSGTNTLTLTRVTEVPAGEGLYIVGTAGSYEIPEITTVAVYSNLLKGVTRATTVSPTDGSNTNFILSNGSHGVGFYTLSAEGELAGGKAYLQLPTASVAGVKALNLVFDDDATGIDFNPVLSKEERVIYNIAGQRVSKAQKGLYIIDGKKVFIK